MFEKEFENETMFLHAKTLEFSHPHTNEQLKLEAKFPENWTRVISLLNSKN